ncbi:hypothetical protein C8R43DRAFT_955702 [Mycena crocata]|nr:hypothetical protein C8R43DRAFT_955702 [Mycena crocata]
MCTPSQSVYRGRCISAWMSTHHVASFVCLYNSWLNTAPSSSFTTPTTRSCVAINPRFDLTAAAAGVDYHALRVAFLSLQSSPACSAEPMSTGVYGWIGSMVSTKPLFLAARFYLNSSTLLDVPAPSLPSAVDTGIAFRKRGVVVRSALLSSPGHGRTIIDRRGYSIYSISQPNISQASTYLFAYRGISGSPLPMESDLLASGRTCINFERSREIVAEHPFDSGSGLVTSVLQQWFTPRLSLICTRNASATLRKATFLESGSLNDATPYELQLLFNSTAFYCLKQKPREIAAVDENKMPKKDVWSVLGMVLAQFWVNQK